MRVLFCLFLVFFCFGGNAFGQKPFQSKLLKPQGINDDIDIIALRNGEFLSLEPIEDGTYIITYFDGCNNVVWCKNIPNQSNISSNDALTKIIETPDSGFIFCHGFNSNNGLYPVITKISKKGKFVWAKKLFINSSVKEYYSFSEFSCTSADDGGYYFGTNGSKIGADSSMYQFYIITRLNSEGRTIWSKLINENIRYNKILRMPQNGVCLSATGSYINSNGMPLSFPMLLRLDSAGKILFVKYLDPPLNFLGYEVSSGNPVSDSMGNIYFNGSLHDLFYISRKNFIICVDAYGGLKYSYHFSNVPHFLNLNINAEGKLIFGGAINSDAGFFTLNLDSSFISFRALEYGVYLDDDLVSTADSGFLSINTGDGGNWITKIDKDAKIGCYKYDTSFKITPENYLIKNLAQISLNGGFDDRDTVIDFKEASQKVKIICGKEYYPIPDLGNDIIICNTNKFTLHAGEDNLGINHKFIWSTGSTDSVITINKSGKYWLAISSGYCTNTDTVNIIFREEIKSNLQDKYICSYDSVLVQAPKINAAKFYWIKPDKSIFKQSDIWAKDSGTYYLMLEGNGNCLNIDTFHLQYYPLPKSSAGPDTLLCYNQTYEMQGKGGITYKWIPAKYLSNDTIANPLTKAPSQQLYILVVKNAFGCADTSQMWLKVKPKLEVKLQAANNNICSGETIHLQAKASSGDSLHYTYKWQNSITKDSTYKTTLQKSGWLKVTLEDGCSEPASDSIFITVNPKPIAAFYTDPKDTSIAENKIQFINQSQNATNYEWSFGTGAKSNLQNPTYIYTDTGKYFIALIATNTNGCADTAYGNIYIQEKFRIFIPNAFSPDGDMNNDVFSVYGTGIKEYSYDIYNRWGQRIFTSSASKPNWNGAVENRGEVVQMDVYFYVLKVTDLENRNHYLNGVINLLR